MDIVCHRCKKAISRDNAAIRCDGTCGKLIHSNCIQAEDLHFLNISGVKEFYCVDCMLKKKVRMKVTLHKLLNYLIILEVVFVDYNIH
ncbi:hypothetical protein P5V15_003944 [Pogonomyrmex californicus]